MPRTRTAPPRSDGAALSGCRPATTASASRAARRRSSGSSGRPRSALAAKAPATAEAALPPSPPESGRPFSTRSSRPTSGAARPPQDLRGGEGGGVPRRVAGDPRVGDREHADAGARPADGRHPVADPGDRDAEAVEARPHVRRRARRVAGHPIHGGPTTIPQVATAGEAGHGAFVGGFPEAARRREPATSRTIRALGAPLAPGRSGAACYDGSMSVARAPPARRGRASSTATSSARCWPRRAIGLLVFTFVLLIDQIPRLLAVLVARSADFATILPRLPEPAALDPRRHDPDGVPARRPPRLRADGERQRDRGPARASG